jgi:hypothetical protein
VKNNSLDVRVEAGEMQPYPPGDFGSQLTQD